MREKKSTQSKSQAAPVMTDAKKFEDRALVALRNAGFRITMPRVLVIRALANTKTALSAYAIHEKIIATDGKTDVVSVYRILSTLQEVGMIHHIGIVDGYFPAHLNSATPHTEVVVNESTGHVIELEFPESVLEDIRRQGLEHHFEATTIKIEIMGNKVR